MHSTAFINQVWSKFGPDDDYDYCVPPGINSWMYPILFEENVLGISVA